MIVQYRIIACTHMGPAYPLGEVKTVKQDSEDSDYTHWVDWADGDFVICDDPLGEIEIFDQTLGFPIERIR